MCTFFNSEVGTETGPWRVKSFLGCPAELTEAADRVVAAYKASIANQTLGASAVVKQAIATQRKATKDAAMPISRHKAKLRLTGKKAADTVYMTELWDLAFEPV